jgi:hypothetical protein
VRFARLSLPIVAVLALAGTGTATAASARAAAEPPKVIKLVSVSTKTKDTDKPPKGPSRGDRSIGASKLFNGVAQFGRKQGQAVGTDTGVFVLRDLRTLHANGTAKLPGGTLHFQGVAAVKDGVMVIPVVSGTGIFVGAHGALLIPIVKPGTKIVANVYELTYQAAA